MEEASSSLDARRPSFPNAASVTKFRGRELLSSRLRRVLVKRSAGLDEERKSQIVEVGCILHRRHERHRQFLSEIPSEDGNGEPEGELRKIVRDWRHLGKKLPVRLVNIGLRQRVGHSAARPATPSFCARARRSTSS
jgi:hypothetical protein